MNSKTAPSSKESTRKYSFFHKKNGLIVRTIEGKFAIFRSVHFSLEDFRRYRIPSFGNIELQQNILEKKILRDVIRTLYAIIHKPKIPRETQM